VTLGHPFYVHRNRSNLSGGEADGDWVLSESLRVGDLLLSKTGEWLPILSIQKVAETNATFNFEVEQNHDYFVGENGWLVHNQSWKSKPFWGHTFETHGQGSSVTRSLTGRAGGTGTPQGQWLNNEGAADFLRQFDGVGQGPFSVRIPPNTGQIINPGGAITQTTRATIIPKPPGGFRTAYPIP
jgi:hypothetical protein